MNVFAVLVVLLFVGSGLYALIHGRFNDAVYSLAAAVLNYAVYFKPFR